MTKSATKDVSMAWISIFFMMTRPSRLWGNETVLRASCLSDAPAAPMLSSQYKGKNHTNGSVMYEYVHMNSAVGSLIDSV